MYFTAGCFHAVQCFKAHPRHCVLGLRSWAIPLRLYCILFIHSSFDEHLGCFCSLDFMNTAAVNTWVQNFCVNICFHLPRFLSLEVELLDQMVTVHLPFWGALPDFFQSDCVIILPYQKYCWFVLPDFRSWALEDQLMLAQYPHHSRNHSCL